MMNLLREQDNETLRSLLKEASKIGRADIPKDVKQTSLMKQLFSKSINTCFHGKYSDVRYLIGNEILIRIVKDEL